MRLRRRGGPEGRCQDGGGRRDAIEAAECNPRATRFHRKYLKLDLDLGLQWRLALAIYHKLDVPSPDHPTRNYAQPNLIGHLVSFLGGARSTERSNG